MAEYGIVLPLGIDPLVKRLPDILEDGENELPGLFCQLVYRLGEHLKELDRQVEELTAQIHRWHQENAANWKLAAILGIGPLTASDLVAPIGDAKSFENGRQLAAWLGLVPRQHSTGGKQTLLGISKRDDKYLRTLLVHGARAVLAGRGYAGVAASPDLPTGLSSPALDRFGDDLLDDFRPEPGRTRTIPAPAATRGHGQRQSGVDSAPKVTSIR